MDDEKLPASTSWLEWVVAALGGGLIVATIGYMISFGITHPASPPDIIVVQTSQAALSHGHLVQFLARNEGNSTAANVTIKGALLDGDRVIEETEMTLDYLPQQAERKGGLIFQADPSRHDIRLQAGGYSEP